MLFRKIVFSIFIVPLVSGCSTISYEEPSSGDRARVRFATDTFLITTVYGYSSKPCEAEEEWMRLRTGRLINSSPKTLGMPLWDYGDNAAKEFYIPANAEIYIMFSGRVAINSGRQETECRVPIAYTFKNNHDYELLFKAKFEGAACYVQLKEFVKDASGVKRKRLDVFHNSPDATDSDCVSVFSKLR